jgi:hypothetical protein
MGEELMMKSSLVARIAVAVLVAFGGAGLAGAARAQEPSPAAVNTARELMTLKGVGMFDALIPGVIETVKNNFIPTNPNLIRELNEVAGQLRQEYAAKRPELHTEIARAYARFFTEQELKDILAFYKTPLGAKMIAQEPLAVEETLKRAQNWANGFSEQVMAKFRAEMKKKGHDL